MVAIPTSFSLCAYIKAGAMENWGLVTYREAKIVVKESTSESMKRGTARTVCHGKIMMYLRAF